MPIPRALALARVRHTLAWLAEAVAEQPPGGRGHHHAAAEGGWAEGAQKSSGTIDSSRRSVLTLGDQPGSRHPRKVDSGTPLSCDSRRVDHPRWSV